MDRIEGIEVQVAEDRVATVTLSRPPHNYFDLPLMTGLADTFEALDREPACWVIVLRGAGKHFCAGAQLGATDEDVAATAKGASNPLYDQAVRLAACALPVVAEVQGAAIGGGLGLALVADFRVASPEARFAASFAQLGMHQGFGISVTLPAVVGQQKALDLLYTGRRVTGEEAFAFGLADRLVPREELSAQAHRMATDIATSAPLAVRAIRATMRGDLAERMGRAALREHAAQRELRRTQDYREGVRATAERRPPRFTGQ